MKNILVILVIVISFSSCSEYQKALKAEDIKVKFLMGDSLYQAGKYAKANRLFEQIIPQYRGKPQAEKLMFLNADASYQMGQYFISAYHFERFVSAYPKSQKIEEARYKSARSYYELSPVYSKDQEDTVVAIEKIQEFINLHPESTNITEANALVRELDFKLEKKAFETAKQYNRISDFKASIAAVDNFIIDFPGASLREEALFIKYDSAYKLATKSVERKKQDRLETAITLFTNFKTAYANSAFLDEATKMHDHLLEQLEQYDIK